MRVPLEHNMSFVEDKPSIIIQSAPLVLDLADNIALNGETINLHSGLMCYKVTPKKGNLYQSMQGKFRSVKIEFGSHVKYYQLPRKAIFFLTSEVNSYGVESAYYADGDPYIAEVALNHEKKLILQPKKFHYLPEMREGCYEKSVWEMAVEGYLEKSSKIVQVIAQLLQCLELNMSNALPNQTIFVQDKSLQKNSTISMKVLAHLAPNLNILAKSWTIISLMDFQKSSNSIPRLTTNVFKQQSNLIIPISHGTRNPPSFCRTLLTCLKKHGYAKRHMWKASLM